MIRHLAITIAARGEGPLPPSVEYRFELSLPRSMPGPVAQSCMDVVKRSSDAILMILTAPAYHAEAERAQHEHHDFLERIHNDETTGGFPFP